MLLTMWLKSLSVCPHAFREVAVQKFFFTLGDRSRDRDRGRDRRRRSRSRSRSPNRDRRNFGGGRDSGRYRGR